MKYQLIYIKEKSSYYQVYSSVKASVGTWYTVVSTYDGNTLKIYVNGVLKSSTTVSGTIKPSQVQIGLGTNPNPSNHAQYSNVDIETIDIYDRALTANEISAGYSGEIKVQNEKDLLKHVDFATPKVGEVVPIVGMNAMFVWIPRYEYNIGGTYGICGESKSLPGKIGINFISKSITTASSGYRIHPAFNFGGKELSGVWVGKFETTGTFDNPTILPNSKALDSKQKVNMNFQTAQKFNSYMTGGDAHMAKNSEWGAVAYLSQSKYGKYGNSLYTGANKETYQNKSSSYITGNSNGTPSQEIVNTQCTYDTLIDRGSGIGFCGGGASTTGNITGIYDMSGGAWESVMGYLDGYNDAGGFTTLPNSKYYEVYTSTNPSSNSGELSKIACNGGICYGHALSETAGWYNDLSNFVKNTTPWFFRGGGKDSYSVGAGIFYFSDHEGNGYSFRVVIS